jgi:uncharacterized coiled-coil protein SlyX
MNFDAEVWRTVAAVAAPTLLFLAYWFSRKHNEAVEDTNSFSTAITAMTDAYVNIDSLVQARIKPLNDRIAELEEREEKREQELAEHAAMLAEMSKQLKVVMGYVATLRRQVREAGLEPYPFPPELDGLQFD